MAADSVAAETLLYAHLTGDATLTALVGSRVYAYLAPPGTALPYIIFSLQGGSGLSSLGGVRAITSAQYAVKVVGDGNDFVAIQPIADQLDVLLQGWHADGPPHLVVDQSSPLQYLESREGKSFAHIGGVYRFQVQPST